MLPNQLPQLLYRYFTLHGSVHIPGLGQLNLCRIPAINDFIGKKILPFSYVIRFDQWEDIVPVAQLKYIQKHIGLEPQQLQVQLNDLGAEMKSRLEAEGRLEWQGLGFFSLNEHGDIVFHQKNHTTVTHTDVRYRHVIREKIDHAVIVGEQEKTLAEMEDYFEEKKSKVFLEGWKRGALILLILVISLLAARLFMGNFSLSQSPYRPLNPVQPSSTHIILK
jgi:hypothetical protein